MTARARALVLAGLVAAGCAVASPLPRGYLADASDLVATIEAEQAAVVRAAGEVLSEWGFTVADADAGRGVVQTAELEVEDSWRGAALREYVYCGAAAGTGVEQTTSHPTRISVRMAMRQQDLGATLLRIAVTGSVWAEGETHACRPTARMARELIAGIRAAQ